MLSLSVNRWGFTDKLFEINNLSGKRRVFTDKITFCETTIIRTRHPCNKPGSGMARGELRSTLSRAGPCRCRRSRASRQKSEKENEFSFSLGFHYICKLK